MAGETWTLEALREHIVTSIVEMDRRINQRFDAYEKSIEAARVAAVNSAEKLADIDREWRRNANEWRGAMDDREDKLMTKVEAEAKFDASRLRDEALDKRLDTIDDELKDILSRNRGLKDAWGYVVGAFGFAGVVFGVVAFFTK